MRSDLKSSLISMQENCSFLSSVFSGNFLQSLADRKVLSKQDEIDFDKWCRYARTAYFWKKLAYRKSRKGRRESKRTPENSGQRLVSTRQLDTTKLGSKLPRFYKKLINQHVDASLDFLIECYNWFEPAFLWTRCH